MPDINFDQVWFNLYQIGIAFMLALPIAFNREYVDTGGAGLRTYPLHLTESHRIQCSSQMSATRL